jgi:hypothetical protein
MQWHDVRTQYPHQWVLIEALEAHSEGTQRVIEQIAVINRYADPLSAMHAYQSLHQVDPERELYVLHTDREQLAISERRWLGIRGVR